MMRVDDVPLPLAPFFHAYGYGLGAVFEGYLLSVRRTCPVERVASSHRGPRIECIWHENLPAYLATCLPIAPGERAVWMNHPAWYMRPVHLVLGWNGVGELVLGSSGHGGRAARDGVVDALRAGASTNVAVDGPAGPPLVMKRGALDMSLASGVPIVAIRFEYARAVRAPTWDRKHFPLPGSAVRVIESEPFHVTEPTFDAVREAVTRALG